MQQTLAIAIHEVNSNRQFINCYNLNDNGFMNDVRETRRLNLKMLVERKASTADFARFYQVDATYISQLLNGHRNMGEKSARNLEAKCGLPEKWLDQSQSQIQEQNNLPVTNHVHVSLTDQQRQALAYLELLTPSQRAEWFRWAQDRRTRKPGSDRTRRSAEGTGETLIELETAVGQSAKE